MSEVLQQVLARARQSPFYKERLASITRFEEAPLTSKHDLRSGYPFQFLAVEKENIASYHESSGTEGTPIASCFSHGDWNDVATRFLRSAIKLSRSDTFFIKTPYSMVTTAHQAHRAGELAGSLIVPGSNRTTNMPYSRVVQLLKDLDVTVTWSLPNEVVLWAHAAKANGLNQKKDFPNLRAFWVAGEALSPSRKALLSELWGGKKIYEDYGSTETGSLAGECERGRLHAWSDRLHFEIFDSRALKLNRFGQGQLVVTPLFREAMPLIRYLIEDEVVLTPPTCDCGSDLPNIEILGRRTSQTLIQNHPFFPREIEEQVCFAGRPFGLSLWKAIYSTTELNVVFYSEESMARCAREIEEQLLATLGVRAKAKFQPIEAFIDPSLFQSKLDFSKPSYLSRREHAN